MPTYAFVNAVSASPAVLFDLDNQAPFSVVVGTQTPPPQKRYSQSGSTARDGDNIAQSSYNDRVLTIALRVELGTTAEQQVEGIQKLARLLDAEQWLMWQHDTMIEPVFFRTRRGDIDIDDNMMVSNPKRVITLTIPAEPFAYGLPVTGTATIANDPTAATNPMSVALPAIQGDVATPLSLQAQMNSDALWWSVYNTAAGPSALVAPRNGNRQNSGASASGWTVTIAAADSAAIGGTATTLVKASGTSASPFVTMRVPNVEAGDFRLFARVKSSVGGSLTYGSVTKTLYGDSQYWWVDFGVIRPQGSFPASNPPTLGTQANQTCDFLFTGALATTGTIALDHVLLIPAGVDGDVSTKMLMTATTQPSSGTTYINPLAQTAWIKQAGGTGTTLAVAGGFPVVVPGQPNRLTLVARSMPSVAFDVGNAFQYDDKTLTTVLSWQYYPQYLYIRPATT